MYELTDFGRLNLSPDALFSALNEVLAIIQEVEDLQTVYDFLTGYFRALEHTDHITFVEEGTGQLTLPFFEDEGTDTWVH